MAWSLFDSLGECNIASLFCYDETGELKREHFSGALNKRTLWYLLLGNGIIDQDGILASNCN